MRTRARLRVAACQFPVTADVAGNGAHVRRLIARAATRGAHLVQFPEAALSGYGGFHFRPLPRYDWELLRAETRRVREAARSARVFVLLGSAHRLRPGGETDELRVSHRSTGTYRRPLRQIDVHGRGPACLHPGDRRVVFSLRGVRCGVLVVCYDGCYPEQYAAQRARGVEVVLNFIPQRRLPGAERAGRVQACPHPHPRGRQRLVGRGLQLEPSSLVVGDLRRSPGRVDRGVASASHHGHARPRLPGPSPPGLAPQSPALAAQPPDPTS